MTKRPPTGEPPSPTTSLRKAWTRSPKATSSKLEPSMTRANSSTTQTATTTWSLTAPENPKKSNGLLARVGPGVITGVSDDDPSGIATYTQVGSQFGFSLLWVLMLSFPLMGGIQEICARIGLVTGRGLAGNLRRHFPRPWLYVSVGVLLVANTINIGADIGAMAASLQMLAGGPILIYTVAFGVGSALVEVFVPYHRYVALLKWLCFAVFSY